MNPPRHNGTGLRPTMGTQSAVRKSSTILAAVSVLGQQTLEATKSAEATRLPATVVAGLPNNGRNYLNLTLLTPNVAITQGPDGDVISTPLTAPALPPQSPHGGVTLRSRLNVMNAGLSSS